MRGVQKDLSQKIGEAGIRVQRLLDEVPQALSRQSRNHVLDVYDSKHRAVSICVMSFILTIFFFIRIRIIHAVNHSNGRLVEIRIYNTCGVTSNFDVSRETANKLTGWRLR